LGFSVVEDSVVVEDSGVKDFVVEDSDVEDSDVEADTVTTGAGTATAVTSLETVSVDIVVTGDPISISLSAVPGVVTVGGNRESIGGIVIVTAIELVSVTVQYGETGAVDSARVESDEPMAADCVGVG
jgi:hypothetical protein